LKSLRSFHLRQNDMKIAVNDRCGAGQMDAASNCRFLQLENAGKGGVRNRCN